MTALGEAAGPRPSKLGRYELITQIGQGGMAEVQLALQRGPAGFEKLVVVKLVHANLATQKAFVDMLLDEARVAALVKHPNVVDIYDLGEADGRYFIAMEYLEGEPLLAVLRAGREGKRLDPLSTGRLIADTAEGLDAAHELRTMAGEPIELVHHDVSLGNIVVLYNGQVKLVDFGVAKATQSAGPRAKVQGKFSYMAPEKLRGSVGDRRSDIWSLGCVLWEALTLRRLFKGGNDSETMRQVLENKLATPSSVNGDVPTDFDPIVMKALERDPDKRYATAKEMASDLEEVLRENKYGGKNDVIARYMQSTFEAHIAARKKLLQEVSSKGRASEEVLEAAFTEVASGSPVQMAGEFSVKFRRPTGALAIPEEGGRSRHDSMAPPFSQRTARPSGSFLSQPYETEAPPPGGGTAAVSRGLDRRVLIAIGAGILLLIVILAFALGGGGDDEPAAGSSAAGTGAGEASGATPLTGSDGSGSASMIVADGSASGAGSGTDVIDMGSNAAGSNDAAGSGVGSATGDAAGSGDGSATGDGDGDGDGDGSSTAAGAGSDAVKTPTPNTNGNTNGSNTPRPPRVNANEMFKAGMQAYVKGDHRTAVGLFRKAVQANAGYATAWRALGLAHEKLGEWGQAKTALQKYLQLAPNAADAVLIRQRIGNL